MLTAKTKQKTIGLFAAFSLLMSAGAAIWAVNESTANVNAVGTQEGTYWSSLSATDGSVYGNTFRAALQTIMNSDSSLTNSYSALNNILSSSDYASSGYIHPFYRAATESSNSWNKEHVWPSSRGAGENAGYAGADPQVIRPTNTADNSSRSNYMYGETSSPKPSWSTGWDPASISSYYSARGEAARIVFYAATRYYNKSTSGAGGSAGTSGDPLELSDVFDNCTSGSSHKMGKLSYLLEWNNEYPVTTEEVYRNDYLDGQGYARNPFIDHPTWANYIWSVDSTDSGGGTSSNDYVRTVAYTSTSSSSSSNAATSSSGSSSTSTSTSTFASTSSSTSSSSSTTVTSSVTILPASANMPTTYPTASTTYSLEGLSLNLYYVANYSSKIQFKKSLGYMNNSTALSPISSIVVTGGSGSLTVTCGSTSSLGTTITPTVSGTTYTYDLGGATYFNIAASSSAAITASSITFNFDSSNVAVTGVSLSSSTLTLTVGGSTSALTATISPSNATNQSVAWSSSNTDVASVVGGVVSPVASGNAIITVTTSDGSYTATCNVTVSTATTTLQSISVSGSTPDCTFGAASYAPSGLTVTAHYSDSSTADVTSGATFGSPDSKILGVQTPSVTYSTASSTYSVKVTNVGAVQGSGSASTSSISFVPNAATTGASGSSYVTALTSFTTSSTTFGIANWNPSTLQVRGNQAVSATDTNFYLCNTTALPGPITKITLNAASSCLIGAKWSLAIGTASLGKTITGGTAGSGSSVATSVSISLSNVDSNYFCLYVNASGATSGTALLSSTDSIVIEYTVSSGSQFFTDEEQASAWSTYFLAQTSGNCSNTVVWSNLEAEYEAMSSTAQAYFVAHEADTYASAYQRYASAISWYGLTAYIGSGSSALSTSPSNGTENSVIAIAAVAAVFALSLTGYIFLNRRKKHE